MIHQSCFKPINSCTAFCKDQNIPRDPNRYQDSYTAGWPGGLELHVKQDGAKGREGLRIFFMHD